jgi:hypothetical protein
VTFYEYVGTVCHGIFASLWKEKKPALPEPSEPSRSSVPVPGYVEPKTPYRSSVPVPGYVKPKTLMSFQQRRAPCPKCQAKTIVRTGIERYAIVIAGGICIGRPVFLWRPGCSELRPHFHARCLACGSRWVMAPADANAVTP